MDVLELIEQGEEALLQNDFDRLQRVAERIIEARHIYGFELLARAHAGRDNLPRAIAVLQEGVGKAPQAWTLWMLLGELRSDHGEYDLALLAYDTALGIDGADADEVHVNAAIVHERAGRAEDALMRLHEVRGTNGETAISAARVRAQILLEMERPDAAAAAAKAGLARMDDDTDPQDVAPLHSALAKAAWLRNDRAAATHHAWEAIECDPTDDTALWLVREIEGAYSEEAKYFRILVHGRGPEGSFEDGPASEGFWRKVDVVADDENEAMQFIARLLPEDVRPSLRSEETEVVEEDVDQAKGVYWCSPAAYYREEE